MEVGTVVHVFVRDVADHQKCAECAKKLYDYQYIYILVMYRKYFVTVTRLLRVKIS